MAVSASFRHYGFEVPNKEIHRTGLTISKKPITRSSLSRILRRHIRQIADVQLPRELLPLINKLLPLDAQRIQTEKPRQAIDKGVYENKTQELTPNTQINT